MNKELIYLQDTLNTASLHDPSPEVMKIYSHIPELREIDNRGNILYRPIFSHSSFSRFLPGNIVDISEFAFDKDYLYAVTVHHNAAIWSTHLEVLPDYIVRDLRAGKCKLILDDSLEGPTFSHLIDNLYQGVRELNIPPEQVYYVTNNLIAEELHEKWLAEHKKQGRFNIISFMYNVVDIERLIQEEHVLPENVNIEEEIEFKVRNLHKVTPFLKVNRTNRPERNLAMLYLKHHGLLNNFRISFPQFTENDLAFPEQYEKYKTEDQVKAMKQLCPFDIDDTDRDNHGPSGIGKGKFNADLPFQPVHYRNTLFSFVLAAFPFWEESVHLHSSTFNPIYCGHPIIQFGPPGSLRELRKRGFKTFGKWWDESYDEIEDGWERFGAVMEVIRNLCSKSKEELLSLYIDMKETLQHNVDLISKHKELEYIQKRITE